MSAARANRLALAAALQLVLLLPLYAAAFVARLAVEAVLDGWAKGGALVSAVDDWCDWASDRDEAQQRERRRRRRGW